MRRKSKVEKISIHVSIPKELFEESELYIENFSAYFTACLKNKIDSIRKHQMKIEENNTDIIQNTRTNHSNCSTPTTLTNDELSYLSKHHPDFYKMYDKMTYTQFVRECRKLIESDSFIY